MKFKSHEKLRRKKDSQEHMDLKHHIDKLDSKPKNEVEKRRSGSEDGKDGKIERIQMSFGKKDSDSSISEGKAYQLSFGKDHELKHEKPVRLNLKMVS